MLGMHGTVVANYAVDHADLLLAFGVRFDDRVTGKLEAFAVRPTHLAMSLCGGVRLASARCCAAL